MAVVQISKIQVRRGKKSQTNLPQLAGGEFGWAVDTQQLYIGNGSVGEGAPYVGNTEILTERSNIFDLLGAYTYKGYLLDNAGNSVVQTGADSNQPFTRSLQEKLDDIINVRDFGAAGDYSNGVGTDDTNAIQRAIDQLYLNSSNKSSERSRRRLMIPAGVYKITRPLYIPSNVTLLGDGSDKTVIFQDDTTQNMLITVASSSGPGNYVFMTSVGMNDDNAPQNVLIQGITFIRNPGSQTPTPMVLLDCLRDSRFSDCRFQGVWNNGTGQERAPVVVGSNSAIQIRGLGAVTTENVIFEHCEFKNVAHAVYSDYDSSRITFTRCRFNNLFRGLSIAQTSTLTPGQTLGPQSYVVSDSVFDKVDAEAWKVFDNANCRDHRSINNKFYDVGNNSLEQSQPTLPVLDFMAVNCDSVEDYFQRNIDVNNIDLNKTGLGSNLIAYVPDVLGVDTLSYPTKTSTLLYNTPVTNPKILLKTPAWSSSKVVVDYVIKKTSSDLYRSGQLVINIHPDMAGVSGPSVTMTESFTYTAQNESIGSTLGGNIRFFATVANLTAIDYVEVSGQILPVTVQRPTLLLRYANPSGPGGNAIINYTVTITSGYKDF
jgi:hypothetical protein